MLSDETVERVRSETSIAAVVGERVRLQKRGRSLLGLCPFHQEKTPSFHVNEERGFYHCFGCGASGDAIRFVRELDGLTFVEAVRRLAETQGIEIVETGTDAERKQQAEVRRRRDELYSVSESAAAFFERMLRTHPLGRIAHAELARRGLDPGATPTCAEALRAFRVGYAPYGWSALADHLRTEGFSHHAAERVGLLAPRKSGPGHYDRFRHRLMFAILDLEGRVIAFSGRALDEPTAEQLNAAGIEPLRQSDGGTAKYINSPESPIYKKREAVFGLRQARTAIRQLDRSVLVEGNFDVVSLHARGLTHVAAPLGTAFTAEQGRQLKRFSANVILLFDGDEAGRRATLAAQQACDEAGLNARVASLPDGTDPDDLVRQDGIEAIEQRLAAAKSLLEYRIDAHLQAGFESDDVRQRAATVKQVAQLIAAEEDPTTRALAERYADRIAERLGIADVRTFRALARTLQDTLAQRRAGRDGGPERTSPPPERARSRDRRSDLPLEILGALLDFPSLLDGDDHLLDALSCLKGDTAIALAAMRQTGPGFDRDLDSFLSRLPPAVRAFAGARLAAPRHEDREHARSELLDNLEKLRRLELSRQKGELVGELERLQSAGDFDQEMALLREQARRAKERHGL